MNHTKHLSAAAAVALCALATIAPSAARADGKSAMVSLAGLDLSTDAGQRAARERVHQTARTLCGRVVDAWTLSAQPDFVHCVDDATTAALKRLQGALFAANVKPDTQVFGER
ncbi:MAG: UrcA family protein [Steroidobacteraceae bacterium]